MCILCFIVKGGTQVKFLLHLMFGLAAFHELCDLSFCRLEAFFSVAILSLCNVSSFSDNAFSVSLILRSGLVWSVMSATSCVDVCLPC